MSKNSARPSLKAALNMLRSVLRIVKDKNQKVLGQNAKSRLKPKKLLETEEVARKLNLPLERVSYCPHRVFSPRGGTLGFPGVYIKGQRIFVENVIRHLPGASWRFAILKKHFKVVFRTSVISLNSKAFNSTE